MQDYRCNACAKLLFRIAGEAVVAVKCPRCKVFNTLNLNAIERPYPERPERPIKGQSNDNPKII